MLSFTQFLIEKELATPSDRSDSGGMTPPLTKDEHRLLARYLRQMAPFVEQKYPHSEWCELETGLWHTCDCGAAEDREKAFDKLTHVWLKRRGCVK